MSDEQNAPIPISMDEITNIADLKAELALYKPKYKVGQRVDFKKHNGRGCAVGEIRHVETTHPSEDRPPYHVYSIYREGYKLFTHVGQSNILSVL